MRWPFIYYSKLCWRIKVLKTFQIKPGTYSSAESWEYIRAKLLLLMLQSPKKTLRVAFIRLDLAKWDISSFNATSITCSYANHVPKSTSENQQVCLHGEKIYKN